MNIIPESLNECGWIYICIDLRDPFAFKVGLTKARNIFDRVSETTNPYYMLVRGYRIPDSYIMNQLCNRRSFRESDWYYLERYIHKELEKSHDRVLHCMKGTTSEWFEGDLEYAIGEVNYYFARTVSLLDEDGNHDISNHVYDPIINVEYFGHRLYRFANRNKYVQKLKKYFDDNPRTCNITLTSALNIPYVT
ncbi:GIY-YIG nuclease family protein [Acinetobacter baumannii]|uniref:GIY-YIG nuclease family protein n=1 Tax=Acinetobacter baumannii TaxID=470 RepID=A0AAP1QUD0_ACIBA|nr:GIY-YIG nuclease family protein [Acinetobacter baumannii]MBD2851053.1 GIY-YIG nuclease family protein [Acinetobacter baumannii]MBD3132589.1 GIY-YIG nuclease family protein [Acinetobacter baumannii]MBE0308527.1 GIY-YIG nuclease family protein [Acinetobacter baumannii]MBE0311278.1 GIY-YIG nuclease family protein [Acinetobacter baumannii]MBE0328872.1 GIY-YIG nuclease family protein [Acinetobacter baumannii]